MLLTGPPESALLGEWDTPACNCHRLLVLCCVLSWAWLGSAELIYVAARGGLSDSTCARLALPHLWCCTACLAWQLAAVFVVAQHAQMEPCSGVLSTPSAFAPFVHFIHDAVHEACSCFCSTVALSCVQILLLQRGLSTNSLCLFVTTCRLM